ncbi:MAG: PepSY domain-containing protein [Pseudomonadales bacterium]|nr:PepSY domain-containing protein [Pseudomonadales bacterium]
MNKASVRPSRSIRRQPPLRHRLHRPAGVAAGVVLLHLVLTGLPLQFTEALHLATRPVTNSWILDWYGLKAPETALRSGALVHLGERLYLGSRLLGDSREFAGAVSTPQFEVALNGSSLWLIGTLAAGEVEQMAIGRQGTAIGLYRGGVVVDTGSGLLQFDDAMLNLEESTATADEIRWATLEPLQGAALDQARTNYRRGLLSTERLLQDLHSGRAFGAPGVWVVNGGTLLMILLSISGYLIWWRSL